MANLTEIYSVSYSIQTKEEAEEEEKMKKRKKDEEEW
jgi:hypothetical protein